MLNTDQQRPKRLDTAELHDHAIQRVISAFRDRLDESITLKEMARLAYMSRFHFVRTFRQITGLPPRRFLSALRVQSATRMLLDTNHRVTDICLDVGYSSLGTFVRRFSEVLGVSPMRLRSMRGAPTEDLLGEKVTNSRAAPAPGPTLSGGIQAPVSFSGPIFIGLFPNAIPEGTPLGCTIQFSPGRFRIPRAPRGHHHLFAVGIPWPGNIRDYFTSDFALRGGGKVICIDEDDVECGEICLREAEPTDPPILVNLPALLSKKRRARKVA